MLSTGAALLLATGVTPGVSVMAAEATNPVASETAVEDQTEELKRFVTRNDNGTISFNNTEALNSGYSEDIIKFVQENIVQMNDLVINHNGVIDENLTVTAYISTSNFRAVSGGVTKITRGFGGQTNYYLNASDTQQVIDNLERGNEVAGVLSVIFKGYSAGFVSLNTIQKWQFEAAASGGNGVVVIMTPSNIPGGSPEPIISVIPQ